MAEVCLPGDNPAMTTARWKHKLARFSELDGADKRLLLRAVAWLAVARLMIVAVPFNRLAARLSADIPTEKDGQNPEFFQRIGRAVSTAAGNVPWRSDCFPQTIAARMLLKRHGYASTIHLGVERVGDSDLAGHAWLTCGGTVVTGGVDLDRYIEIHRLSP